MTLGSRDALFSVGNVIIYEVATVGYDSLHFAVTHVTDATRTLLFLMVGWENRTVHTLYILFRGPTVQRSHDQPSLLKRLQRFYVNKLD